MQRSLRNVAGFAIALQLTLAATPGACADNEAQADIDSIVAAIEERRVGRIEIVHISEFTLTYARIDPTALETGYEYKFIIADLVISGLREILLEAVASMSVSPGGDYPDLRWGVIFFDRDDNRIGAIYFARGGERGIVNWTAVDIDGGLYRWLRRQFRDVFS